jgi:multidrug transporter EmrE-like cation transporter
MIWAGWFELVLAIGLGTIGQVSLKYALRTKNGKAAGARRHLTAPLLVWIACYAATTLFWLLALRSIPLSKAFPILGLQYALIPILATRILSERLAPLQWSGIALIMAGVVLVGRS